MELGLFSVYLIKNSGKINTVFVKVFFLLFGYFKTHI